MNKFLTVTALMILMMVLAERASAAEPGKLRYYSCAATMAQRLKLLTGEAVSEVLDKSTCTVVSDTNIERAVKTALKETSMKTRNGGYGLVSPETVVLELDSPQSKKKQVITCDGEDQKCLAQGRVREKTDSLFVFTEAQILPITANLVWAQEYGRSLSIYFFNHQSFFDLRGEPNPLWIYNLQSAELVIESPGYEVQ